LSEKREIVRYQRYRGYDYSRGAVLFITIVTEPRRALFGVVRNAAVELSPLGREIERSLLFAAGKTAGLRLYEHVIMPDHLHFRVYIEKGQAEPLKTLGGFIRRFKTWTTRVAKLEFGLQEGGEALPESRAPLGGLWQQGYHDWLCLSEEMIAAVIRYIAYNPLKYELRYNQPAFLAIREPLASARLSPKEFWRGIGAVELLDGDRPFIALRISRRLSPQQVAEAVARIRQRVGDFVFVSGWISPGEKAVRDMLLAEPQGQIVEILLSAMPHDYKVGSMWLPAIQRHRAAIIARGNSEEEFSRAACLEANDAARRIAEQGLGSQDGDTRGLGGNEQGLGSQDGDTRRSGGMAIYWLPEGPKILKDGGER